MKKTVSQEAVFFSWDRSPTFPVLDLFDALSPCNLNIVFSCRIRSPFPSWARQGFIQKSTKRHPQNIDFIFIV